jgi:general secretion pathway protein G
VQETKAHRGFTLIELLVVISIIGLLSSVVLASLNSARSKARDAERASDINQVNKALELYYSVHGAYPSTGNINTVFMDPGCKVAVAPDQITSDWVPGLVSGGFIPRLPIDPRPQDAAKGSTNGGACYMYSSDGKYYMLSAWDTVETPITSGGLYAQAGYREPNWNMQDARYMCNYQGGPLPAGSYFAPFYQHSYTITNEPCTW